jgi:uncharacterized protein YbjT (DUF2867 family)
MLVLSAGTGRVVQGIARELARLPGPKRFLPAGTARSAVPGFEPITAGAADRAARARALEGARELVILPTFDARAADAQCALVREAAAAGIRRIRLGSLIGADPRSPVCLLRWVGLLEREVIGTGVAHDVLRCAPFMQNLALFIRRDAAGLTVAGPFRDAAFPWLDAADVGVILAGMLEHDDGGNLLCQLSGPEQVGFEVVAQRLGEALRERVRYVDVSLPEAQGLLEAHGFTAPQIRALTEYWDYLVSGVIRPACCDTALRLLGRAPRTLPQYFAEHAPELRLAA